MLGSGAAGCSFLPRGSGMMQAEADMRKYYSEREIRANYEELTKLLINHDYGERHIRTDCFIDH